MKRRTFIKGVAAGLAASVVLRKDGMGARDASPAVGQPRVIAANRTTVVETTAGKIRGYCREGIYVFKGIPYSDPTGGTARFMPPAKTTPWPGIRNTLRYGPVCPAFDKLQTSEQNNRSDYDEDAFLLQRGCAMRVPGEDCLQANVWTPQINGSHGRPVMVYMHGGGYESGSGHDLLGYDGENLARDYDVVVVTHNHRLNAFGYLNLAEIGGPTYAASANVGLLDLVAVLEWVRDNIAGFGGDAGNVTIFGQSGGGGKVVDLMAMPAGKGLFHKAAIQSGPFLRALTPEYSTRLAWLVLRNLGLGKNDIDQLHAVDQQTLALAAQKAHDDISPPATTPLHPIRYDMSGWAPTVDGVILPRHPFDPDGPPISADVPLLTGTVLHEAVSGVGRRVDQPDGVYMTEAELYRRARDPEAYGDKADDIIAAYRRCYPAASPFDLYATLAASPFRRMAGEQALRKAAQGAAPAYVYIYAWRTPTLDDRPGPFHACEISHVFNNATLCDHYSCGLPEALELNRQVSAAWVHFARTGNPNHPGLPHWPAYTADSRATLIFDTSCTVRNEPEGEGLRLIASAQKA